MSPLLFLIFINDLVEELPKGVECSLFADDAALYCSHTSLEEAQRLLQEAVTVVERWSVKNKLDLNLTKSCTFFFSSATRDASWRPDITLHGEKMPFGVGPKELNPQFLGVTLDRSLCFADHVENVCKRVGDRCKMLACLASRSWGWKKHSLRRVFTSTQRSIMDYAASAWQPWLSSSQMEKLERTQNKCLRLITGQYSNSDLDAVRLEAGVPSYQTHSNQLIATAYEKGLRMPTDHPRRTALVTDKEVIHRHNLRSSCRERGKSIVESLPIKDAERKPKDINITKPWSTRAPNWKVTTNQDIKNDIPAIKVAIEDLNSPVVIYTDGSCTDGTTDGGAAAVVTVGSAEEPECVKVCQAKGNQNTCSYMEEWRALELGINWVEEHPQAKTAFCTDSLSLLQAIDNLNPETDEIRTRVEGLQGSVDLMYVPGHKDVPGNELADKYAKEAAKLPGPYASEGLSFSAAKSCINRLVRDEPSSHRIISKTYADVSEKIDRQHIKSRKHGALIAQLRTGHHKNLNYYKNFIDKDVSAFCERCNQEKIDTV